MEALDVRQVLGKRQQQAAVDGKGLRGKVGREERSAGSRKKILYYNPAYVRLIQLVLLR